MPYPETCPECGGAFRNTGTHYTARRNEVGRHVLLELGCQNTSRRYWWDFTSGNAADDSTSPARRDSLETTSLSAAAAFNGVRGAGSNGSVAVATLDRPLTLHTPGPHTGPRWQSPHSFVQRLHPGGIQSTGQVPGSGRLQTSLTALQVWV